MIGGKLAFGKGDGELNNQIVAWTFPLVFSNGLGNGIEIGLEKGLENGLENGLSISGANS